ncbi:hypothetical protein AWB94_12745 [Mycolicibacterium canariasense]|nr:hypothetical protein AWB94_12745 [Mycolicibacterium canariasense]
MAMQGEGMHGHLVVAALALCLAAAVQTLTGAGFGLTAAPPLLLAAPALVPDTLLWLTLAVTGYSAWADRRALDWRFARVCTCAAVPGIAAGLVVSAVVPGGFLGAAIAVAVIVAGAAGLAGLRLPITPMSTGIAGFTAGALNWVAALPGPPVTLVYRAGDAATVRATLSAVFLAVSAVTLAMRYAMGRADASAALWAAELAGAVLLGAAASRPLGARLSSTTVSRMALALSTAAGVVLLVRA